MRGRWKASWKCSRVETIHLVFPYCLGLGGIGGNLRLKRCERAKLQQKLYWRLLGDASKHRNFSWCLNIFWWSMVMMLDGLPRTQMCCKANCCRLHYMHVWIVASLWNLEFHCWQLHLKSSMQLSGSEHSMVGCINNHRRTSNANNKGAVEEDVYNGDEWGTQISCLGGPASASSILGTCRVPG